MAVGINPVSFQSYELVLPIRDTASIVLYFKICKRAE